MSEDVQLAVQGEVAFLQLARPTRGNAMRPATFDALRKASLRLSDAPPLFLVLTGEGPDFCVGLDVDSADGMEETFGPLVENRDAYRVQEVVTLHRGVVEAFSRVPCPVIAAIEGRCFGAGLELALFADIRIASETATFALPGVRAGLFTGLGGVPNLAALIGASQATEIALTGRTFTAEEADHFGLVNRLCGEGAARATALDMVAELKRHSPRARLQTLLTARAVRQKLTEGTQEQEIQCAARAWIAGDWRQRA